MDCKIISIKMYIKQFLNTMHHGNIAWVLENVSQQNVYLNLTNRFI